MHSTGSFILTVIERVRAYLDDSDLNAKYDEDFIVRHVIPPTIQDIMGRLALMRSDPILLRHAVTIRPDQPYYQLPPCVASVWRLALTTSDGDVLWEAVPRGEFHPCGPNWSIEGNVLSVRASLRGVGGPQTLTLWYVPSGDFVPHYSASGGAVVGSGNNTVFTLAASPIWGPVDRRPNAYAGSILRILPPTGVWQERLIESSDAAALTVTVRLPFEPSLAGSSGIRYEIAPPMKQYLWEAIATGAALKMGTYKAMAGTRRAGIEIEYRKAMKTCKDMAQMAQGRIGGVIQQPTVDTAARHDLPSDYLYG